jgi:hypothetical protein
MLYYNVYSTYPEMGDFLVSMWDAQNRAKNEMKQKRKFVEKNATANAQLH